MNAGATAHPRGLRTLFFTEMWERFSYYGMRALLILFMTAAVTDGGLGFEAPEAGAIYGLFTSAVYLLALPGGWVADRLLGQQQAVWYGGILISAGNFLLAVQGLWSFYVGLLLIVLGTGLLKPNVSAIVGELYRGDSGARRDAGFSIFYMGINLGAFLAPLIAGTVAAATTWRWGFATAGVAMALGLVQFRLTRDRLGEAGLAPHPSPPQVRRRGWTIVSILLVALALLVGLALAGAFTIDVLGVARSTGTIIVALSVFFFGYVLIFGQLDSTERGRVWVIAAFFVAAALFWAGYEQAGSTFNLFARDYTDRSFLGGLFASGEHPASWYQSVPAIYVIAFSPVFAWVWVRLAGRGLDFAAPLKFAFGLVFLGLGFVVMVFAARLAVDADVLPTWLLVTYLLHVFGELCLSPIGLSAVTKLAPHRYVGQMMGTWFMGAALGNLVAGVVGGHLGGGDVAEMPGQFLTMAAIGIGAGTLMLLTSTLWRRMMGGVR